MLSYLVDFRERNFGLGFLGPHWEVPIPKEEPDVISQDNLFLYEEFNSHNEEYECHQEFESLYFLCKFHKVVASVAWARIRTSH